MTGRHHVVANAFALVPVTCAVTGTGDALFWASPLLADGHVWGLLLGMGLFMLGALLPDADTRSSAVGRYVRLPGRHRTWTHAVWVPLLLVVAGVLWLRPLLWLAMGWLCHILVDSWSRAGVCWLWPLTDYVRYPNGAFVARGHRLKLYRTGADSRSERRVLFLWCVGCVAVSVALTLARWGVFHG